MIRSVGSITSWIRSISIDSACFVDKYVDISSDSSL